MSSSVGGISGSKGAQSEYDKWSNVGFQDFVELLVTEMQSQDPMEPMDNSQIMEQVSQISSIQATQKLNASMEAVILGENLSIASNLLERQVVALNDEGDLVTGEVSRVSIESGTIKIYVGDEVVNISNVAQILPAE
jgi:flagellar basal-body rod modification protein FlgD